MEANCGVYYRALSDRNEAAANLVGDIGRSFQDIVRLGDGAEGGAFAATERTTGRRVVLKRVPAENAREVRYAFSILRRTGSPHLPAPRALIPDPKDGAIWMVTDWVPGSPLPAAKASSVAEALAEARAVAHALAAIHGAGTHHGDVSPSNIVVTPTGGVVLVDLGQLGRTAMGTPGFLAPEVLAGGGGPAADRFSVGCVLCMRLLGSVPWARPESLMSVRDAVAVAARIDELGGQELDRPVRDLLIRLLDPRLPVRLSDPQALVARLARLHAAADGGFDLRHSTPWWTPSRWPYRGPSLEAVVTRLGEASAPRLVAVVGPSAVGRGRVAEELVQVLQGEGRIAARMSDASRLPQTLGCPDVPWLEAWRTAKSAEVVGVHEPPPWPLDLAADDAVALRAAVLEQVSAEATATLVIPVAPELGEALQARGGLVVSVAPWSEADVQAVLQGVVDDEARKAWAHRLHAATGGWPARVIRATEACAAAQLDAPDGPAVVDAIAQASHAALHLDVGTARAVMLSVWGSEGATSALADHLHDGERPWATVEAAARARLGAEVASLAADVAAMSEEQGDALSLGLAIDADRPAAVETWVSGLAEAVAMQEPRALTQWLDADGAARLTPASVAALMRRRLAQGQVDGALKLASHARGPQGQLVHARALQRKGRIDAALRCARAAAASALKAGDSTTAWSACGLGWRLQIDAGRGEAALDAARESLGDAPKHGIGPATARLWGAMAALAAGAHDEASVWLDQAIAATETEAETEFEAAGVCARAQQLHGNLAQAKGQLREAQARYAAAARLFERAGEAVGGLMLRGSLAGLAVLANDFAAGIEHGHAALGGLLGRGQISATLEAGLNQLQLLVRVGAHRQAFALGRLLQQLHGGSGSALVRARLARVGAELAAARVRPGSGPALRGALATTESRFLGAATALGRAAGSGAASAEAAEAWRRAAAAARGQGELTRACEHLAQARAVAGDDEDTAAEIALEAAAIDLARDSAEALERVITTLADLPKPEQWRARGRIDLLWIYDRTLLSALHRRLPPSHPARRRVAQRWCSTLELVMKQTAPLDRPAVRSNLLVDGGDAQPLRELLAELDQVPMPAVAGGGQAAPVAAVASPEPTQAEHLLRIYRRLAREDRLDVLLQQVVDTMMELTDAERGAVVVQPTAHTERLEVTRELAEGSEGVRFSRSVIDRVLADGEPVMSVDAAADDRFDGSRSISHLNLRSVLAVPLHFRGERLGAAYVDHRLRRGNFDEADLARMEEFAELAALAVAHARAVAELRAQAEALTAQRGELSRLLEAREVEVLGLREEVRSNGPRGYRGIIGGTPVMQRIFKLIDRVADAEIPVVIHGESGTGKELVARAIHDAGPRASGPFIAENCGAIPETLLESVLFGHAKGAFTGAGTAKAGLFEAANGGTIFLDEVGEMSAAMQTKLLRVLQEGEVRRVGENHARAIDVRVIAASNRDLEAMVERGELRRDLYYRINVVKIELPALRDRLDDLPALVDFFLGQHETRPRVTAAAMRRLAQHTWPGNVRELENEVQRWIALVEGDVQPDDLSMTAAPRTATREGMLLLEGDDLEIRPRVERMERRLIAHAMDKTGGNQTKAAQLLGLSRYGLQKKLRRFAETPAPE